MQDILCMIFDFKKEFGAGRFSFWVIAAISDAAECLWTDLMIADVQPN